MASRFLIPRQNIGFAARLNKYVNDFHVIEDSSSSIELMTLVAGYHLRSGPYFKKFILQLTWDTQLPIYLWNWGQRLLTQPERFVLRRLLGMTRALPVWQAP